MPPCVTVRSTVTSRTSKPITGLRVGVQPTLGQRAFPCVASRGIRPKGEHARWPIGVADEPSRCASESLIDLPFDLSITMSAESLPAPFIGDFMIDRVEQDEREMEDEGAPPPPAPMPSLPPEPSEPQQPTDDQSAA